MHSTFKAIFALSLTLGTTMASADAWAVQHRFEGALFIIGKSGTCDYDPTGSRFHIRFRPSGLGTNGSTSGLSLFELSGALNYEVVGRFAANPKIAQAQSIFDHGNVSSVLTKVAFLTQNPSTLTVTTEAVAATGSILGFDEMAGCTIQFRMGTTKRPE